MDHRILRIGAALLVPGLMVLVDGLFVWWSPVHLFGLRELPDLFLASYATWLVLAPFVIGRSRLRAVWIGIASPFLGAFFLLLIWGFLPGPLAYEPGASGLLEALAGGMVYAVSYIFWTAPFTLLVGIVTALLLRILLSREDGSTARVQG